MTAAPAAAYPTGLPAGLAAYKRTDEFTAETVPAALLKDHSTKEGTWGLIHVTAGRVLYAIRTAGEQRSSAVLRGISARISPATSLQVLHRSSG